MAKKKSARPAAKKKWSPVKKAAIAGGAGLALAATAAGIYLLAGKRGAKNRKTVKGWALKAKAETLQAIKKAKKIDARKYVAIVEQVARRYKPLKNVDSKELAQVVRELKGHWKSISAQVGGKKVAAKARPRRKARK